MKIEWYLYNNVLLPKTPPHVNISLNKEEQIFLIKKYRPYFIRYSSEFDSKKKYPFWYVIKDEKEDLSKYPSKIRWEIRKGLKECNVEKISINSNFVPELYFVYKEAYRRYKNVYNKIMNIEEFEKSIINFKDDLWIVKKDNLIIGYGMMKNDYTSGHVVNLSVLKYHPDYLKFYSSYALVYEINRYYLNEKNVLYIHDGARSLGHETNIHNWLIQKFRYRKAFAKLHIAYRKDIELFIKIFYPFRKVIYLNENIFFKKLSILIKHEEIKRLCLRVK